ncbi:MAG: recombinase family protein [Bdellovibrionota bacterium]
MKNCNQGVVVLYAHDNAQVSKLKHFCGRNNIDKFEILLEENKAESSAPSWGKFRDMVEVKKVDRVFVYSFSSVAKSSMQLLEVLEGLEARGVSFVSLLEKFDSQIPTGKGFLGNLKTLVRFEKEVISDRTKKAVQAARAKGKRVGRKRTRPSSLIRSFLVKGLSHREISLILDVSVGTVGLESREWKKERGISNVSA